MDETKPLDDAEVAYSCGRNDRRVGKPATANPFEDLNLRLCWNIGWAEMDEEIITSLNEVEPNDDRNLT